MNFEELFKRYQDSFGKRPAYKRGSFKVSNEDLLNKLGSEIDLLLDEFGTLDNFAESTDPNMILQIYSIDEAEFLMTELQKALS